MLKNLHLIISILVVVPIAFIYGLKPKLLFNIQINSIDEANVFKAIMMIYLAFATFWIYGILNSNYWKIATITNCLFMLSLGFGRILSIALDGIPSIIFIYGSIGEFLLGFYGFYLLNKNK
jgi:hypothetical protein